MRLLVAVYGGRGPLEGGRHLIQLEGVPGLQRFGGCQIVIVMVMGKLEDTFGVSFNPLLDAPW